MAAIRGIAIGLAAAAAIAACASSRPAERMPSASSSAASPDQLAQWNADIERDRAKLGLGDDAIAAAAPIPALAPAGSNAGSGSGSDAASCHRAAAQVCTDTCTLADSICDDTKRVCDLASQLVGDASAADSCQRDQKICSAASAKCCGCTG